MWTAHSRLSDVINGGKISPQRADEVAGPAPPSGGSSKPRKSPNRPPRPPTEPILSVLGELEPQRTSLGSEQGSSESGQGGEGDSRIAILRDSGVSSSEPPIESTSRTEQVKGSSTSEPGLIGDALSATGPPTEPSPALSSARTPMDGKTSPMPLLGALAGRRTREGSSGSSAAPGNTTVRAV